MNCCESPTTKDTGNGHPEVDNAVNPPVGRSRWKTVNSAPGTGLTA